MNDSVKGPPQTPEQWDARYQHRTTPWDTGRVSAQLKTLIVRQGISPGRWLEVGCGTGTDAIWLASMGFSVTGVDFSELAITQAREKAQRAQVEVSFSVGSIPEAAEPFDGVYDCGCFHTIMDAEKRRGFAEQAARCLGAGGLWFSLMGSTDGPPRDHGPPRRSVQEIAAAVEPEFEILSLTTDTYDADIPSIARAWVMLAKKRTKYA